MMVGSSSAQLEPESFTILKEAMNANPPTPAHAVMVLLKYQDALDQANLQVTWLRSLKKNATGTVTDMRKKMQEMLDAFDDAFAPGDSAKQRARTFIKLRDELLARSTPEMEIEHSASVFVDRLWAMPKAHRSALQEFGWLVKRHINNGLK
jgi:hypothetical protein